MPETRLSGGQRRQYLNDFCWRVTTKHVDLGSRQTAVQGVRLQDPGMTHRYGAGSVKRYGVCPSVRGHTATKLLLQVCAVGPAGRRYRSIAAAAAGECGQCHVVSVRRWLNTACYLPAPSVQTVQLVYSAVFTARCYASAVLAMALCLSVCPSVCLSVTSRSSTKTAKRRITRTTLHDSPGTLVF